MSPLRNQNEQLALPELWVSRGSNHTERKRETESPADKTINERRNKNVYDQMSRMREGVFG